ncbi:hypothetical protein D9M71_434150 [compost metagenome]
MRRVDFHVIGVGLVQVAVHAKDQAVGQRPAEAEVDTLASALGIVLGKHGVQGHGTAQVLGRAFGDDVHHATHGPGAVASGGRAAQDFDALDFFGGYPVGFAAGVTVAAPAITHGIARGGRLAVDEDQGVFRAHAAQVDLAVVAARTAAAVAGKVDPGFAADDVGEVVDRRALLDVFSSDDRHTGGLFELLFGGAQHFGVFQLDGLAGACDRQVGRLDLHFIGGQLQRSGGESRGAQCCQQGNTQGAEVEARRHVKCLLEQRVSRARD